MVLSFIYLCMLDPTLAQTVLQSIQNKTVYRFIIFNISQNKFLKIPFIYKDTIMVQFGIPA